MRIALFAVLALILAAGIAWWQVRRAGVLPGPTTVGEAAIGGHFSLIDHYGQPVTEHSYDGKLRLVFFGFTYCPELCPTELADIGQTLDLLGDEAREVQPLFITVDPERDTPEALAGYVSSFHPSIVGLTGTPEQVAAAARDFRVYYAKAETGDGDYLMDHTTYIYLMDRDGSFLDVMRPETTPEVMAEAVRAALDA